jgi:hypothetical protein
MLRLLACGMIVLLCVGATWAVCSEGVMLRRAATFLTVISMRTEHGNHALREGTLKSDCTSPA